MRRNARSVVFARLKGARFASIIRELRGLRSEGSEAKRGARSGFTSRFVKVRVNAPKEIPAVKAGAIVHEPGRVLRNR